MAYLDPFLHDWDERFHALVAKSLMTDPLHPRMMYNPLYITDKYAWCCNYTWLHKQPLFMWQMALSMKIFGVSEFSIRYPSVLMGSLMVVFLYRIVVLTVKNRDSAFLVAALFCFSNFHLQLISGFIGMDHNDVAFGFYVLASLWAYIEYVKERKVMWILLIGAFAGCAILNKWLTGLVVFSGWGVNNLLSIRKPDNRQRWVDMLIAVGVCCLIFLPWQIYITNRWPDLSAHEYALNRAHLFEVVEGHVGTNLFYWERMHLYYGNIVWVFVVGAYFYFIYKIKKDCAYKLPLLVAYTVLFVFFSFVVKTKVQTFFFVAVPLGYVFLANLLKDVIRLGKYNKWIYVALLIAGSVASINTKELVATHVNNSAERDRKIYNTNIYKHLSDILPDTITQVMNVNALEHVEVMFYNDSLTAYHFYVSEEDLVKFKEKNITIGLFQSRPGYIIPMHLYYYGNIHVIDTILK